MTDFKQEAEISIQEKNMAKVKKQRAPFIVKKDEKKRPLKIVEKVATKNPFKKKLEQRLPKARPPRAVICVKHIPHGFYEDQLISYFGQFGKVKQARVIRSVKTGRNIDRAFVEFYDQDIAQIAAEAMNNYLMFGKLIKCEVVPSYRVRKIMFADNIEAFHNKHEEKHKRIEEREDETEVFAKKFKRTVKTTTKMLKNLGINFKFTFPKHQPTLPLPSYSMENKVIKLDPDEDEIIFKGMDTNKSERSAVNVDKKSVKVEKKTHRRN